MEIAWTIAWTIIGFILVAMLLISKREILWGFFRKENWKK